MRGSRVIQRFAVVFAILIGAVSPAGAVLQTEETSFLPTSPLLITGYQTKTSGADLNFIELYNTSDSLVRLQDWAIFDMTNNRSVQFASSFQGFVEPKSHVLVARSGIVAGMPTFSMAGWEGGSTTNKIVSLRLKREGYRPLDVTLSTRTIDLDMPMIRTYNATSYSTAASPFEPAYRKLFDDGLYQTPAAPTLRIVELYPYSSDCAPNDTSVLCSDYIKIQNIGGAPLVLDGYVVRTTSSSTSATTANTFTLGGELAAGEYRTVWLEDDGDRISLTNSGGYVWIEDLYHLARYDETMTKYESAGSAQQGLAYARSDGGVWQWTATPTPSGANVLTAPVQLLAECLEGKYRNPDTNRCRNIEDVISELTPCDEGYERNPTTNRCRKLGSTATTLTPCNEGQIRNPETNRCRSIISEVADLLPCSDGYERNPATNRCRKNQGSDVKGASFPVEPVEQASGNTAALWTLGGVAIVAGGYGVWEWRHEISRIGRSFWNKITWWRK